MHIIRRSQDRGYADHGWLKSFHSFSFAGYHDPDFMGWGNLRVVNEDRIAPGTGFGTHGHQDMEIISYVLSGNLAHQDSMGNVKGIPPGDVQRMSAGTGVRHSEFNHDPDGETHFLQIWILPSRRGIAPGYEQKTFAPSEKAGVLRLVASPDAAQGSVQVHANARMYAGCFEPGQRAHLALDPQRKAYVQVLRGSVHGNGHFLDTGDALLIQAETGLTLDQAQAAEVLVFDLEF